MRLKIFKGLLFIAMFLPAAPVSAQWADVNAQYPDLADTPIDQIIVYKSARTMFLQSQNRLVRSYLINLGGNPAGHKQFQGDERTPEGTYRISHKNPNSKFHLSLLIDYPNLADIAYAESMNRDPGDLIAIHGYPKGTNWLSALPKFLGIGWTDGCIAVSNRDMEEIWEHVSVGTSITIYP